jgi:hypothetical protein
MVSNLVRISRAEGLPLKKSTLYKWVHLKKHPELFVKLGGAVYVDLDALKDLSRKGGRDESGKSNPEKIQRGEASNEFPQL